MFVLVASSARAVVASGKTPEKRQKTLPFPPETRTYIPLLYVLHYLRGAWLVCRLDCLCLLYECVSVTGDNSLPNPRNCKEYRNVIL